MNPYTIEPFDTDFYVIDEGGVRCFLVIGSDRALLIDTGFGKGDLRATVETLTALPVTVIQTHTDGDHFGATSQFDQVLMHPSEFDYFTSKGGRHPGLNPVWEDEQIVCGLYTFRVILIPGHTPGSIALLEENRRFLIGGDSLQAGAIFMFGPGRNMPAYLASMRKLESRRSAFDTILASHHDLSVPADILPDLIEAAELQIAGKLQGGPPGRDLPCLLYRHRRVSLLV